jgi:hypothetical protein
MEMLARVSVSRKREKKGRTWATDTPSPIHTQLTISIVDSLPTRAILTALEPLTIIQARVRWTPESQAIHLY